MSVSPDTDADTRSRRRDAAPQGKRERLVEAAAELIHRHGFASTTLAAIAASAEVELGNVYYYFRTKDEIAAAVIDHRRRGVEAVLAEVERRHRSPRTRLTAFVDHLAERAESTSKFGCPFGNLASELARRTEGPDLPAASVLQVQVEWVEKQLRAMGHRDAQGLALDFIASYQGAAVLTNSLGQPQLMVRHAQRLRARIGELAASGRARG